MNITARALPKFALTLALAAGATAALAGNAKPAQAAVSISVGIGAYAPAYHWYGWRDGGGWHRRWVPIGWAPPAVIAYPRYGYAAPVVYGRPTYWHRDWDGWRDGDRRWVGRRDWR